MVFSFTSCLILLARTHRQCLGWKPVPKHIAHHSLLLLIGYWLPASCGGMVLIHRQMLTHFPTTLKVLVSSQNLSSQLTTHCSLLTAHYPLLTTHCSLLTAHYSLLTTHCSLLIRSKRLHDDVLNISKKTLSVHLAVFFPFVRQKHPVFPQRSIRSQCPRLVNKVRYVFEEVHDVESERADEGVEHG